MATERFRVAARAELPPGTLCYADADGLPIALANVAGEIFAFGDVCRHEGGSLASGALIGDTVACPWHGWTYSVRTGKALVPPVGIRVPVYPVELDGDAIYVLIDWEDA